jgi:hypothetical protein
MATKSDASMDPVSKKEIAALSKKLDDWGATLPGKERALLQLIVSKARLVEPDDVRIQETRETVGAAVSAAFKQITKRWTPQGWARIDPIWYKHDSINPGDEVEISAKVQIKTR